MLAGSFEDLDMWILFFGFCYDDLCRRIFYEEDIGRRILLVGYF